MRSRRRQSRYSEDVFDTTQQVLRTADVVLVPSYERSTLTLLNEDMPCSVQYATTMVNTSTNDENDENVVVVFDLLVKKMKVEVSFETSRLVLLNRKPLLDGEDGQDDIEDGWATAVMVSSSFGAVVVRRSQQGSQSICRRKRKEGKLRRMKCLPFFSIPIPIFYLHVLTFSLHLNLIILILLFDSTLYSCSERHRSDPSPHTQHFVSSLTDCLRCLVCCCSALYTDL